MRVALFDPFSGIAGDMTVGALLDAGASPDVVRAGLDSLGLGGYEIRIERRREHGFACTRFDVDLDHDEHHPHRGLSDCLRILDEGALPAGALRRAHAIFEALAHAEAAAHGSTPDEVHFHEVGAIDAIVDIAATSLALEDLGVEAVHTRTIQLGGGTVTGAHGTMPVPAPGTAALLEGLPVRFDGPEQELATPTGVAILAALATRDAMPVEMRPRAVGYGAGSRPSEDLPNLLRVFLADVEATGPEQVWQIEVNLDDASPEILGPVGDRLRDAGALDAYFVPAQMKKGRPGVLLTALAPRVALEAVETAIFVETTSFGLRRFPVERTVLERAHVSVETPWGAVRVKEGRRGEILLTASPEFDDCLRVAGEAGVPLRKVHDAARAVYAGRSASSP